MKRILLLFVILCTSLSAQAQEIEISGSRKAVRTSGDVLAFVTPVASLATVLALQDWQGLKQGALVGHSGVCGRHVCRVEPDVCQETRLVGRRSRSCHRCRQCLSLHPPVRRQAQPDHQPGGKRRTFWGVCFHELLILFIVQRLGRFQPGSLA